MTFFSCNGGGNAVGHDIFHFGMHFLVGKILFLRCVDHCFCHRVREMLLQAGSDTKQLILALLAEGNNLCNGRSCLGQGTCLIKYNGVTPQQPPP